MAKSKSGKKRKNTVKSEAISGDESSSNTRKVKVKVLRPKQFDDPLVVAFPRGVPASMLDAEDEIKGRRSVSFETASNNLSHDVPTFSWSKLKATSSRGKAITGSDKTCTFKSSNQGRGYDGRLAKLYVGIYDKSEGTVTLQQAAERGQVFSLQQEVKGYIPRVNDLSATMKNMTPSEKRMLLFEAFGSAKKQRALRSQAANVVNIDSVIGAGDVMLDAVNRQDMGETNRTAMEDAAAGRKMVSILIASLTYVSIHTPCVLFPVVSFLSYIICYTFYRNCKKSQADPIEIALNEARRRFLPPYDETAESPHKVYDAMVIAGDHVWGSVSRVTDACTKKGGDWRENLTGRGYWHKSIKILLNSITAEKKSASYQIKTTVMLNSMIKFHSGCNKRFYDGTAEDLAKKFGVSNDLSPRFLELFAVPTNDGGKAGFAMSKQHKDKRLVHMLILYVLAHGRSMKVASIDAFCEDLQMETPDAAKLLREAGFHAKKTRSGTSVFLTCPVEFPGPRRGKR